jgi:hypothetical protein
MGLCGVGARILIQRSIILLFIDVAHNKYWELIGRMLRVDTGLLLEERMASPQIKKVLSLKIILPFSINLSVAINIH